MIHRIGMVLGFKAHRAAMGIGFADLAGLALQKVAAVKLDGRLVRENFQHAPARGVFQFRGKPLLAGFAVDDKVVVVAFPRGVIGGDAIANDVRRAEIKKRARHFCDRAGGDERVVGGREVIGIERQLVAEHRPTARASEVPIGVVGKVHRRGLCGGGLVINAQLVGIGECVSDFDAEVAGVALLAIGAGEGKGDGLFPASGGGFPNLFTQCFVVAAVEVVGVVVYGEGVLGAVDREFPFRNAIANAAGCAAKVLIAIAFVTAHVVKAIDDVDEIAVLVRHVHFHQRGSVSGHLGDEAVLILECVNLRRLATLRGAEGRLRN